MTKLEKVIKELQWLQSNFPLQDKPEDDADRMCNAIHKYSGDAIALLESQQWISVKDRLPPEDKMVLVWHWDYEIGCLERDPYIHELRWSFNDFKGILERSWC